MMDFIVRLCFALMLVIVCGILYVAVVTLPGALRAFSAAGVL